MDVITKICFFSHNSEARISEGTFTCLRKVESNFQLNFLLILLGTFNSYALCMLLSDNLRKKFFFLTQKGKRNCAVCYI